MIAQLDGIDLPCQFSYTPLTVRKRLGTIVTYRAVIHQVSSQYQIIGDSPVSWKCDYATKPETQVFLDFYNQANPNILYIFTGYWGEQYEVLFPSFKIEPAGACRFNVSGTFVPIQEIAPISMGAGVCCHGQC